MRKEDFQKMASNIPRRPGVYQFLDGDKKPIYIGKAKSLKNRLSSYFVDPKNLTQKTRVMVRQAKSLIYTVLESEMDAYLHENTMIKKHQPRYNIMLKDGKTYTYICIKKERFPRVFFTRKVIRDGSQYFGPYTSKWRTSVLMELIKELFPLRTCTLNLSKKNVDAGKYKVCLEYHIGNCMGPCANLETEEEYHEKIKQIRNILNGNLSPVRKHLMAQIYHHAERLEFEKAEELKQKMAAFVDYQSKSTVVSTKFDRLDVFSIELTEDYGYFNYLKISNGFLVNSFSDEVVLKADIDEAGFLEKIVPMIRSKFSSEAEEVITPLEFWSGDKSYHQVIPKIGDKKHLLDLSFKNLMYHRVRHQKKLTAESGRERSTERILRTMQKDLNLEKMPFHIECFDNSNLQGSNPVSSCVVIRNAKPAKREYRHFNIKTVVGPDDFASMIEVVSRRYKRMMAEVGTMPDLIIIDGGKGQLSAAANTLENLGFLHKTTVIGIAKRLEEIYFPGDPIPVHINKKSETLKVIQQARNEAHRFAITFHRDQRSRRVHRTVLTDIPGVGQKTASKLLTHFKSVARIEEAKLEEIETVVGPALAKKVRGYFGKKQEE